MVIEIFGGTSDNPEKGQNNNEILDAIDRLKKLKHSISVNDGIRDDIKKLAL